MNLEALKQELIRDEGIVLDAYKDTAGLWTIGVGHLLGPEKRMITITSQEAEALLVADMIEAANVAAGIVGPAWCRLEEVRQRVLVNMAFNLGSRLKGFTRFLNAVRLGNYPHAAIEMMDSKWAAQVGPRAERLRDLMLKGWE
jgi:lysozyme